MAAHRHHLEQSSSSVFISSEESVRRDIAVKSVPFETPRKPSNAIRGLEDLDIATPFSEQKGAAQP